MPLVRRAASGVSPARAVDAAVPKRVARRGMAGDRGGHQDRAANEAACTRENAVHAGAVLSYVARVGRAAHAVVAILAADAALAASGLVAETAHCERVWRERECYTGGVSVSVRVAKHFQSVARVKSEGVVAGQPGKGLLEH